MPELDNLCLHCMEQLNHPGEVCPHCGIKNPGLKMKEAIGGLVIIGLVAAVAVKCSGGDDQPIASAQSSADCLTELQCWGDKNVVRASVLCKTPVEHLAKYTARWTDGALEGKFPKFRWLDKDKGSLTFIGDKVEFQNGFGAYQAYVYECDFLPGENVVLAVRAEPGHL